MTWIMEIQLAYGGSHLQVTLPKSVTVDSFAPAYVKSPVGYSEFVAECDRSGAEQFLSASSLLFVVNDGFRHTPTEQVLGWIEQRHPGVVDHAHFLIATGTHKPPTEDHYRTIFGRFLERVRPRLHFHVATDRASMVQVGVDSFDQSVLVNKLALDFERIVVIGSVEPHYFAGYTGGRKGIFPGLCDIATTERNHNMANSLEAAPLKLEGNPVAEHLQSLLPMVSNLKILSIQLVADVSHRIGAVCIGELEKSFTRAVEIAEKMYAHRITEPYDAVLCEVLPPIDNNLYQVQKAVENCHAAVVDGGLLLNIAACREGIGSDFFFNEAARWDSANNRPGDGVYRFGSHKLTRMVLHQRRIRVCLKSELPDSVVSTVYYHPIDDIAEYLGGKLNGNSRVAVVHDAAHTVLSTNDTIQSTASTREKVI
ncbi:MAG: DUF2088 domain-containing protein [bacterium]|nr:DUF2088 domain-containing protein [bacterium]